MIKREKTIAEEKKGDARRTRLKTQPPKGKEHSDPSNLGVYDRRMELPRLIALWPSEVEAISVEAQARLVALLRHALRRERQRGLAGSWTYDITRHARLLRAYTCELSALESGLKMSGAKPQSELEPVRLRRRRSPAGASAPLDARMP